MLRKNNFYLVNGDNKQNKLKKKKKMINVKSLNVILLEKFGKFQNFPTIETSF